MTQPNPGDYVSLDPKTTIPKATTPGSSGGDANGVETHGTSVVQLQEEAWRLRAEAATAAAEELRKCKFAISQVLQHNYFGDGCPEGAAVYEALRSALVDETGWSGSLSAQMTSLLRLSASCNASRSKLTACDETSADRVSVVAT